MAKPFLSSRLLPAALVLLLSACPPPWVDKEDPPPAPKLTNVLTPKGDVLGGQEVILQGTDLDQAKEVLFGSRPATDLSPKDGTELRVKSPPGTRGKVSVTVKGDGGESNLADAFQYVVMPHLTQLEPNKIPANRERTIALRGKGLVTPVTVKIGTFDTKIVASSTSEEVVPVELEAMPQGSYPITVTNGDGESSNSALLEVTEAVRITSVEPNSGFADETLPITIKGSGFAGVTSVTIGGGTCTGLALAADFTSLTCTVPTGAAGPADVMVIRTPGDDGILAGGFNYYTDADPTVRVLYAVNKTCPTVTAPCPGATGRYADIKATGLSPTNPPTVTIAGSSATVQQTTTRYVRVTVPPYSLTSGGHFDMVPIVISLGSQSSRKENSFTYYLKPAITDINPKKVAIAGGDKITITGQGFGATPDSLKVHFSTPDNVINKVVEDPKRGSAIMLECNTPSMPRGMAVVRVSNEFDTSDPVNNMLEFVEAVRITSVQPQRVSLAGGVILEATGTGFVPGRMEVTLAGEVIPSPQVIGDKIRVVMPPRATAGTVRLMVRDTNPGDPYLDRGEINIDYVNHTVRQGGVGGGAINRNISVSVIRQDSGAGIPGAEVFVGNSWANAAAGLKRTTDNNGLAVLATADLRGPVTLVAAAKGFESQARFNLDSSEVTFALYPHQWQAQEERKMVVVSGTITDWSLAGYPNVPVGQVKRVAVVYVAEPDVGLLPPGTGDPELNMQTAVIADVSCDIYTDTSSSTLQLEYAVNAYPNTTIALVAAVYFFYAGEDGVCQPGTLDKPSEEEGMLPIIAGAFGLLTDVHVGDGSLPGQNIPLNRAITTGVSVNLVGAPSAGSGVQGTAQTADAIWDLGQSGVFTFFGPLGTSGTVRMNSVYPMQGMLFDQFPLGFFTQLIPTGLPMPGGDMKYIMHGISGAPVFEEGRLTNITLPKSEVWKREVNEFTVNLDGWLSMPKPTNPADNQALEGRRFAWNAFAPTPTFITVDIAKIIVGQNQPEARWSIIVPGNATEVIIPDLTGAPNISDLEAGSYLWQVSAYTLFGDDNISMNNHTNDMLGTPHWQAHSISAALPFRVP